MTEADTSGVAGGDAGNGESTGGELTLLRRIALGESGFERATVWSAVGLALSYAAFDAAALVGFTTSQTAVVLAAVTALAAITFATTGGGALPTAILAYGPLAGTLLRWIGPEPYVTPFAADGPSALALAEPFGLAAAAAVAVGSVSAVVGYLVDRGRFSRRSSR
ncbi:hypothetical protein [Halorubrum laminariae]|uniref:Integral membrane protein n=1 Tax=Halorubrum laminariae TaxID=1433523 RepID=A0ABD6C3N2_9EURY|nr:hypothetical protein [Halorubrum laminariae]